jgi:hypothetical protein
MTTSRKKPHARPSARPARSLAASVALVSAVALGAAAIWLTHADAPASSATPAKAEPSIARADTSPSTTPVATTPSSDATQQAATPVASRPAPADASAPAKSSAKPDAAPTASTSGAAQQAFIDPRTGKLRPAEHDDVATAGAAAKTSRLARTTAVEPQETYGAGGSIGVLVPDELQPYTVATKAPDGSVTLQDATGPTAAAKMVRDASKKGVAVKKGLVQKKEERNDR